jgi:hypothetical protein
MKDSPFWATQIPQNQITSTLACVQIALAPSTTSSFAKSSNSAVSSIQRPSAPALARCHSNRAVPSHAANDASRKLSMWYDSVAKLMDARKA